MRSTSSTQRALVRPAAFGFFRGLKRNNRREWFEARRVVYEREVREPLKALVEEIDVRLAGFAPEIVGDPRRSLFRIHRDIRFSKDKSPYKTNAGCWFFHRDAGKAVGAEAASGGAGFYFHLEPASCFIGGGIWMPARPALNRLRAAIAEDPRPLQRILRGTVFHRRFGGLDQEHMLKRMPRGFVDDHPAGPLLRYQSFTVGRVLRDREVLSPRLAAGLSKDYTLMLPLVRWLNGALGFAPAKARIGRAS